jgi:hypothetical protein
MRMGDRTLTVRRASEGQKQMAEAKQQQQVAAFAPTQAARVVKLSHAGAPGAGVGPGLMVGVVRRCHLAALPCPAAAADACCPPLMPLNPAAPSILARSLPSFPCLSGLQ